MSRGGKTPAPGHDEGQRICAGRVSLCSSQVSPESGTRLGTDAPDLDAPTGTMLAPVTLTDSTGVRTYHLPVSLWPLARYLLAQRVHGMFFTGSGDQDLNPCGYCHGWVPSEARVCRHCNAILN